MADDDFQDDPPGEPARGEQRRRRRTDEDEGEFQKEPARRPARRERLRYPDDDDRDEPDIRRDDPTEVFIPYRNPKGLTAYYLGVFSLVPCLGLLLGPAALVLGVMGLRYSRAHPTARGAGHAIAGIVFGVITSALNWGAVLLVVIGAVMGAFK
mgnify:CR=1 FL=1